MRLKNRLLLAMLLLTTTLFGQSISSIKQQKEKSEKEISYLNKLLNETKNSQNASMSRLQLLQTKMQKNRSYMHNLNVEIDNLERKIDRNSSDIQRLESERQGVLDIYHASIYNGWRSKGQGKTLLFILSASDFNQAYNRFKHIQQTHTYSVKQLNFLNQLNDSLIGKNKELSFLISNKNKAINNLNRQRKEYEQDEVGEQSAITQLKNQEKELRKKLEIEMRQRRRLANQLNKLIAAQRKKSVKGASGKFQLTPEEKIISADFAKNRGRLPWPVTEGIISEKFGINRHPVYNRVELINDGINITTNKHSDVRSVFTGIVTSVWLVERMNNVVIIQHGNYFTVYTNLEQVYVNKGDKVITKESIGKLAFDVDKGSVLHFQVWEGMNKLNPELWLVK